MAAEQEGRQPPFLIRRLTDEPELLARIETAERLGIAPRRLNGWEPTETTTYEYDADGRLVRSVTAREPEWSEQDQAWMLALAGYRASLCPSCGGPIEECGPESDGQWLVPPPRRCYRMDLLALTQESSKRPRPEALTWRVEKAVSGAGRQS